MRCPKCLFDNPDATNFCGKCGVPLTADARLPDSLTKTLATPLPVTAKGKLIAGKYRIIEEIGRGGMGIVYKAEDLKLKRSVALKFLPPHSMDSPELKERFLIEAQAAAALSHPNICTIHEVEEEGGQPYIVMEFVEGQSLQQKTLKGPLNSDAVLNIAVQVAAGLEAAHQKGIIHRDIKSANIMITGKGQAKIMDFGLARVEGESRLTKEARTIGTIAYMSPEQARGEDLDRRTDIWSFGVVLYEMLTGMTPFRGDRESIVLHSIVEAEPKPLRQVNPDVPEEWQRIVGRAMRKTREDRYASAADMADDLMKYLEGLRAEEAGYFNMRSVARRMRKPAYFIPVAAALTALLGTAYWLVHRNTRARWARQTAIPEIIRLVAQEDWATAFDLARQVELIVPEDPALSDLWPRISTEVTIETDPPGANVFFKDYRDQRDDWIKLGESSVSGSRVPRGFFRWKAERAGYAPVEWAGSGSPSTGTIRLDPEGSLPDGMIRVPGGTHIPRTVLLTQMPAADLDGFLIDKHEVTNRQFKEFLDQGGYQNREFWNVLLKQDGRIIPWEDAIGRFKDRTGRPGPAGWEQGTYPEGQGNYPVSGISWYEAAAFAEFAGKTLPPVYHWTYAASFDHSMFIMPASNFAGKGPSPVGDHPGLGPFGTYDMGGNVREWCWNGDGSGRRYLMGGGWEDEPFVFAIWAARDPFDRSAGNGFRCVKPDSAASFPEKLLSPVVFPAPRDYSKEEPVSDEVFNALTGIYSYDKTDLDARVESTDASPPQWIKEKVSFNAAYGNERMAAYLFLPKTGKPPYQTVVYFPGGNVLALRSSQAIAPLDYVLISGRAFLYPVYKSTYERGDGFDILSGQNTAIRSRDHHVMWYKDFARSIDYLETRADIDHSKLAFTAYSLGATLSNILLALEKRIRASVLVCGAFVPYAEFRATPEADFLNFAPRVDCPTLMLNGRYDTNQPVGTLQKPMFDLLGTPSENKRHVLYDTGHFVPRNELIKETLNWLDKYLGPVQRF